MVTDTDGLKFVAATGDTITKEVPVYVENDAACPVPGPVRVLHDAVSLCGVADMGAHLPLLSPSPSPAH